MALTAREIQDAYVTFFNRAADKEGFTYWTSYPGSISDLYATFAQQTEYTSVYGGKTTEVQITLVYQNLFNRAPDAEGLAYWSPLVEAGTITLANLALTVNRGAQGTDTTALSGKIDAAIVETNATDAVDAAATVTYDAALATYTTAVSTAATALTAATTANATYDTAAAAVTNVATASAASLLAATSATAAAAAVTAATAQATAATALQTAAAATLSTADNTVASSAVTASTTAATAAATAVTAAAIDTAAAAAAATSQTFTLTASAPSAAEGNSGTNTLTYVLSLDKAPTSAVTINYQTLNTGTATAGTDYTTAAGIVTFAVGQTVATVAVTVAGDTTFEADETIITTFSGSELAATVTATGTITNDDVDTANVGQAFTLTTSANQVTGGADNFTGTIGADRFLAMADGALDNGDVIDGGDGADTLTARYSLTANKTVNTSITNVETVLIDTDDGNTAAGHTLSISVDSFAGLKTIGVKDNASTNAAEDSVAFSNIASGVEMAVINGDLFSKVSFGYKTTTGLTDTETLSMTAGSADTITVAGVETININAVSGKSAVDTLTTAAATKLVISGAGDLTLSNVDDVTKTIDASKMTGKLSVDGIGAVDATITGGTGNDTVAMGTTLTAADTIEGGDGVDTLEVGADLTTALTKVTGFETLSLKIADIDVANGGGANAAGTAAISGAAVTGVTKFSISVNSASDNDAGTVTVSNVDNGDTVSIVSAGADTTTGGIDVTVTQTTDTLADAYTLSLEGIGAAGTDTSAKSGVGTVTIDSVETLTIASNSNAAGSVTTNNAVVLAAQAATGIVIKGSADLDLDGLTNTTKLVSIDATDAAGKLTIDGIDASKLTFKAAAKDTAISLAGLNNDDQLIGGAGTKDSVVATAVTGLTATTGKLNIQGFETVELQATGANTIDASLLSGVNTLAISGATPGTQTVTNLAASGIAVSAGSATAVFDNAAVLDVSLADETGTADVLDLVVNNKASANSDIALKTTGIETVNINLSDATTANNVALSMTNSKAATITAKGGAAGAVLALGTLNAAVRTVDVAAYAGEVSFTGVNATAGMTVTASSSAAADDFTTSAFVDTITVGETGAVDVDVDGGNGTDTLNLSVKAGFIDTKNIDNIENVNITVRAGDSITIGANANEANGIDEAKAFTLDGGNELSVFTIGGANDNLAGTTLLSVDGSTFAGKMDLAYAADKLLSTMVIKAGALTTDTVRALYNTTGLSATLQTNGVENVRVDLDSGNNGGETYTTSLTKMVGLKTLAAQSSATGNTTWNVTDYDSAVTLQLGDSINDDATRDAGEEFANSSTVAVTLASASGTADALNINLQDTDNAEGTIVVTAAGVEALNLKTLGSGETHKLDVSGVAATTSSKVAITLTGTGTDAVTLTNVAATANVINASGLTGALTVSDRGSSAMTITGGTGGDSLRMENTADVMTGGTGTDTLVIVQNAVLGGFLIDLSSTTDQVGTYNGSANAAVQSGFESVDVSGVTGSFGADITAIKTGSTIVGTANADQITGGAGNDTITGGVGVDSLAGGAGDDVYVYTSLATMFNGGALIDTITELASAGTDSFKLDSTGGTITIANTDDFGGGSANNIESITAVASANAYSISLKADADTDAATLRTINLSGDTNAGGSNVVDLSLVSGAYVVTGSAGVDTITGSVGVDTITGAGGTDGIVIAAVADTGVATFAAATATSTATLDKVVLGALTDNDTINLAGLLQTAGGYDTFTIIKDGGNLVATVTANSGTDGTVLLITGIYDATAQTFTSTAEGVTTNAVMVSTAATNAGTTATDSIIIVGAAGLVSGAFAIADGVITA